MVAVETRDRVLIASGVKDIESKTPAGDGSGGRILRGARHPVKSRQTPMDAVTSTTY